MLKLISSRIILIRVVVVLRICSIIKRMHWANNKQ